MRYPFNKYRLGTRYGSKGKYWKCGYHSGQDFLSANYGGDGLIYPLYAGNVTGKHLHLEIHKGAYHYPSCIDSLEFIRERLGGDEVEKKIKIRLNGVDK